MNVLRLALVLTLLGGPQALHMGPQDPNFTENLVNGNWFSIARASNEPKLLRTDSDTMFFIHKTHVTFKAMQFHVHRRVKGRCIPIVLMASKTRRKFQYVLKHAVFMEKADPHRFVTFCVHNRRHRKKTVMVDLLTSRTERKVLSDPILASTPAYKQRDPAVAGGPHAVPEATRATACTTGDTVSHKSRQDPHRGLGHPAHVQELLPEPRDRPDRHHQPDPDRPLPARPTVERVLGPGE
ncbi:uterocalin-like isoform X2 [Felis catus]|uniref:Lipocalin/cytosolic fatty-acid binding domain-containing protein n=2 Tax=Felis catus TaxID=9685 RepID=A0ABI8ACU5_FELCA|nr:uterocalin-like isoform X2 [Felis catus]